MLNKSTRDRNTTTVRNVFHGWQKHYKQWKVKKNKEDFELALKKEIQAISAHYNKEIEQLRDRLNEAEVIVHKENKNKQNMQENLKRAFMKGVCALNFEAMNFLNPSEMIDKMGVENVFKENMAQSFADTSGY